MGTWTRPGPVLVELRHRLVPAGVPRRSVVGLVNRTVAVGRRKVQARKHRRAAGAAVRHIAGAVGRHIAGVAHPLVAVRQRKAAVPAVDLASAPSGT